MVSQRTQSDIFDNLAEAIAFAKHFKKLRQDKNMTQEELAFEANVDRVTIARIESAKQNFTFDTIISLSKALKIAPKELLDF